MEPPHGKRFTLLQATPKCERGYAYAHTFFHAGFWTEMWDMRERRDGDEYTVQSLVFFRALLLAHGANAPVQHATNRPLRVARSGLRIFGEDEGDRFAARLFAPLHPVPPASAFVLSRSLHEIFARLSCVVRPPVFEAAVLGSLAEEIGVDYNAIGEEGVEEDDREACITTIQALAVVSQHFAQAARGL